MGEETQRIRKKIESSAVCETELMGFSLQKLVWAVGRQTARSPDTISQHVNHFSIMLADRLPLLQQLLLLRKIAGRVARFHDHAAAFVVEEGAYVAGAGGFFGGRVVLLDLPIC